MTRQSSSHSNSDSTNSAPVATDHLASNPNDGNLEIQSGLSEDWTAVLVGSLIIALGLGLSLMTVPEGLTWQSPRHVKDKTSPSASSAKVDADPTAAVTADKVLADTVAAKEFNWDSPLKGQVGKVGSWSENPLNGVLNDGFEPKVLKKGQKPKAVKLLWPGILGAMLAIFLVGAVGQGFRGRSPIKFALAYIPLFGLVLIAYVMAGQSVIKAYNLEYALWALLVGMIISNTIRTPQWVRPAINGELYIKIGLVLLGVEVLFGRLLALGVPGIFVAWVVTPIVLISTYIFGQRVLKMQSRSLNMVISADMSVCGVSAAIATAAACKAKKEELSLAIGLSLSFTVIMMVVMPRLVLAMGLDPVVAGAWIGGTIDATGAVAAAGEALGPIGSETAVTIKMIQNILIGVIALGVAVYWTRSVEEGTSAEKSSVGLGEIWKRFPKFVLGFVVASAICSLLFASSYYGELWVNSALDSVTKPIRSWLFCFAFVCIGLDTNFAQLRPYFRSGKPLILYAVGQSLNLLLTFLMAYLMFGIIFKSSVSP